MNTAADRNYAHIPGYEHYWREPLQEVFEAWLKTCEATCRPATLSKRRQEIAESVTYFSGRDLKSITLRDIENLLGHMLQVRKLSGRVVIGKLQTLNRVLDRALDDGLIDKNPIVWRKLPRVAKSKPNKVPFTWEEHCKVLAVISNAEKYKDWWPDVCKIAWHTGLRKGDIAFLEKSNVHLDRRVILVKPQKKLSQRQKLEIPIEDELFPILERLMHVNKDAKSPYVCGIFYQYYSNPMWLWQVVNTEFRRACNEAGLPHHHFHCYRHGFVTRLLNAGVDSIIIQQMTGQTLNVIRDYSHVSLGAKVNALAKSRASYESSTPKIIEI